MNSLQRATRGGTAVRLLRRVASLIVRASPLLSFVVAIAVLYLLYPSSFEAVWTGTWKNRMYYLFFLWLISLELILNSNLLRSEKRLTTRLRIIAFAIFLVLPTTYVIATNNLGLNTVIVDLAKQSGIQPDWAPLMPLSIEYMVFAMIFVLIVSLKDGVAGLSTHSISTVFVAMIGLIYLVDNLYPLGQFSPFQIMVIPTATFATGLLTYMGYQVFSLGAYRGMPAYLIRDSLGHSSQSLAIAWPCSGVESLLIYSVTILLFLKAMSIPLKQKVVYFVVGAVVTYVINILRIITIYIISVNGGNWGLFHDYYGSLYSLSWIIAYPLIILGTQVLWRRMGPLRPIKVGQSEVQPR